MNTPLRRAGLAALLVAMHACGSEPKAPPLTAESIDGLSFMNPPQANSNVVMDAMLSAINAGAAQTAAAQGADSSTGFVAVDSTGAVVAGTGSSLRSPQLMLVYSDSAWAQFMVRHPRVLPDSVPVKPDFRRHVVLVSWLPPSNITNQLAYQTVDTPVQRGDTLVVDIGVTAMPIQNEMLRNSSWQAKVWRVDRGAARLVRVTSAQLDAPVTFALP